jgi:hypothetical protein
MENVGIKCVTVVVRIMIYASFFLLSHFWFGFCVEHEHNEMYIKNILYDVMWLIRNERKWYLESFKGFEECNK